MCVYIICIVYIIYVCIYLSNRYVSVSSQMNLLYRANIWADILVMCRCGVNDFYLSTELIGNVCVFVWCCLFSQDDGQQRAAMLSKYVVLFFVLGIGVVVAFDSKAFA